MNNGLSFFIEMRAMMTSTLAQVERAAKHTLTQVEKTTTNTLAQVGKAANHVLAQVSKSATHIVSQVGNSARQAATQASGAINNTFKSINQQAATMLNAVKAQATGGAASSKQATDGFLSKVGEKLKDKAIDFVAGIPDKISKLIDEGMEDAQRMNNAFAELGNMMQRNGTYSEENLGKAIANINMLTNSTAFTNTEMAELQSHLMRVGITGDEALTNMDNASRDLSASLKNIGLKDAGKMITDAVADPKALKSLSKILHLTPKDLAHLQKVQRGHKGTNMQRELSSTIYKKIGGAAEKAFKNDPVLRFNKAMQELKTNVGGIALKIKTALLPALEWLVKKITGVINWMKQHESLMLTIITVLGILGIYMFGASIAAGALSIVMSGLAFACDVLAAAFELLNITNPVFWIIALIAIVAYLAYAFDGWGKTWDNLMNVMKYSWEVCKDSFLLGWLVIKDGFLTGIEFIEKAWYKLKSLWDKDAAQDGLKKINDEQTKRAEEIAKAKGALSKDAQAVIDNAKWEVHSNGKGLNTIVPDIKKKLGLNFSAKLKPAGVDGKANDNDTSSSGGSITRGITSGGPRVININGVKFTDKIELHSVNVKEGVNEIQGMLEEMFLRILNSGAVLQ